MIYIGPSLVRLQALLRSLFIGDMREVSLGYIDNLNTFSEDEKDIVAADKMCKAFEEGSDAILNRNCKTFFAGLGSWAATRCGFFPGCRLFSKSKCMGLWWPQASRHSGRLLGPHDCQLTTGSA
jgi:hypothetical protein